LRPYAGRVRQLYARRTADYRTAYPSAMAVIEADLPALVTHLRFPSEHRKRIRTTNLPERTFVEIRRRTIAWALGVRSAIAFS